MALKILAIGGGIHYFLMIMAAAAVSKWADEEEFEQCSCLHYSPINPYAFLRKEPKMNLPESNKNKRPSEDLPTTVQPDRKKEKKSATVVKME